MKYALSTLLFFSFSLTLAFSQQKRPTFLPFDITIGGQKAKIKKKHEHFARIGTPVSSTASITIEGKPKQVFINIFPCDKNGKPKDGAPPTVIVMQNKSKTSLNANNKKLKPGTYIMNAVISGKGTARVLFEVK